MANYLIHTCNQRFRYVKDYLIPSMINQGISKEDVQIYLDVNNDGCLESCMQAFMSVPKDGNTWHLQDDVIICHDFKERTEKDYQEDIVCGYCFVGDDKKRYIGSVSQRQMWYSFPCIQIPNKIARDCAKWFFNKAKRNPEYQVWIKMKKYYTFGEMIFALREEYKECKYLLDELNKLVNILKKRDTIKEYAISCWKINLKQKVIASL